MREQSRAHKTYYPPPHTSSPTDLVSLMSYLGNGKFIIWNQRMYKIDSSGVRRTAVHSRRLPNLKLDIYVQFRSWTGVPAY